MLRRPLGSTTSAPFSQIKSFPSDDAAGSGKLYLGVGDLHIADSPKLVWTVLGSCVAVILFAPARRISAICHAQLPAPSNVGAACQEVCPHPCFKQAATSSNLRFVTCSIDYMVAKLSSMGIGRSSLACALLGGANVIPVLDSLHSVGNENVAMARRVLEGHAIAIRYENVGGSHGRTVTYHTGNSQLQLSIPGRQRASLAWGQ